MSIKWNFKLKKQTSNYLINFVFFLLMLFEAFSGVILWFVLPHDGQRRGSAEEVFIWSRNTWIDIHDWVAVTLLVVLVIHLIWHWKWIVFMSKKVFKGDL